MQSVAYGLLKSYSSLLRILSPNSGLTRLSFNPLVTSLFRHLPETLPALTREGVKIPGVAIHDYHGRILWLFGSNDLKVSRTVNALLQPGDVFLDIGANYSSIGLSAARRVAGLDHVHLFEPQPGLAQTVRTAVAEAGLDHLVTLHQIALYESDGVVQMQIPTSHSGMATIRDVTDVPRFRTASVIDVQTRETAGYVAPLVNGRSFGVKIDVEGAEPSILPGLLATPGLNFCLFECASNRRELFDLFTAQGLRIFGLRKTVLRSVVLSPVPTFDEIGEFHDLVAVRLPGHPHPGDVRLDVFAARCRQAWASGGPGAGPADDAPVPALA